jgi:hypothetical protein
VVLLVLQPVIADSSYGIFSIPEVHRVTICPALLDSAATNVSLWRACCLVAFRGPSACGLLGRVLLFLFRQEFCLGATARIVREI